jgi:hypothetical protein
LVERVPLVVQSDVNDSIRRMDTRREPLPARARRFDALPIATRAASTRSRISAVILLRCLGAFYNVDEFESVAHMRRLMIIEHR